MSGIDLWELTDSVRCHGAGEHPGELEPWEGGCVPQS